MSNTVQKSKTNRRPPLTAMARRSSHRPRGQIYHLRHRNPRSRIPRISHTHPISSQTKDHAIKSLRHRPQLDRNRQVRTGTYRQRQKGPFCPSAREKPKSSASLVTRRRECRRGRHPLQQTLQCLQRPPSCG